MSLRIRFILIPVSILFFSWICFQALEGERREGALRVGQTPSVLMFAYDSLRSGEASSILPSDSTLYARRLQFEPGKKADKWMPLYVNGFLEGKKYFPGRRVIIFSSSHILIAADVDTQEVLWKLELDYRIVGTPVIDLNSGLIYVKGSKESELQYDHSLFLVSLDGVLQEELKIDMAKLMSSEKTPLQNPVPRIHCKTALGLNRRSVDVPYVYFGCSIATIPGIKKAQYGSVRGIRGSVVAVELNDNGSLRGNDPVKIFFTSAMTQKKFSGFDTGVYNLGSAPSVLEDGSMLVATGNGPVFHDLDNYGCSIVRLSGNSLKPMRNANDRVYAMSMNQPPYNECWFLNAEYTSSAVASIKAGKEYVSAITDKQGALTVFNPYDLGQAKLRVSRALVGSSPTYGQPVISMGHSNKANVYTVSSSGSHFSIQNHFLVTEKKLKGMPNIEKSQCFGYILAENQMGTKPLYLMYSGNLRDTYANAVEGTVIYQQLTSFFSEIFGRTAGGYYTENLWAPFVPQEKLGYILTSPQGPSIPSGFQLEEINLAQFLNVKIKNEPNSAKTFILREAANSPSCKKINDQWTSLYKVTDEKEIGLPEGLYANAFAVDENLKLIKLWQFKEENLTSVRAHPVIAKSVFGERSVLIFLANTKTQSIREGFYSDRVNEERMYMMLLDAKTGEALKKIEMEGHMHFSMPLIVDNLVIVPTFDKGLQVISFSSSFLHRFF